MIKILATLGFCTCASLSSAAVLYDNVPVVDGSGHSVLMPSQGYFGFTAATALGYAVADDFTVGAAGWDVTSLDFYAYQTNASSFTFQSATYSILQGANINTASVVQSATVGVNDAGLVGYRVQSASLTNTQRGIYRIGVDVPDLLLGQGTYFLTWALTGTGSSGPYIPPTFTTAGNAMQSGSAGFAPIFDSGTGAAVELPFTINGTDGFPTLFATNAFNISAIGVVPEPQAYALFGLGLVALGVAGRRRGIRPARAVRQLAL